MNVRSSLGDSRRAPGESTRERLERLNTILLPKTREERDAWRRGRAGRVARRAARLYHRFTAEGRALLALTVFASLFVFDARRGESHVLWAALVGLFVASWFVGRSLGMQDVVLRVRAPLRVTVGEEATFTVTIDNRSNVTLDAIRCIGPFLSWESRWSERRASIVSLEPGRARDVTLRARFFERGEERLAAFRAARLVPFGLALGPAKESEETRLLVVPRVADVAAFPLPRTRRHQPGGVALASVTGESRDLAGVRPYRAGDPVRDLHARSWARVGYPVVREYQQEYFTRVGVVVDLDSTAGAAERLEEVLEVAAGIVARLTRGEDLVDLLAVGESVHPLTLGRSLGSLDQALDLLACATAAPRGLDAEAMLANLAPHLPRLSALVVVSARWGEAHRALAASVAARSVAHRGVVVGEAAPEVDLTIVDVERVRRREPLDL